MADWIIPATKEELAKKRLPKGAKGVTLTQATLDAADRVRVETERMESDLRETFKRDIRYSKDGKRQALDVRHRSGINALREMRRKKAEAELVLSQHAQAALDQGELQERRERVVVSRRPRHETRTFRVNGFKKERQWLPCGHREPKDGGPCPWCDE